MARWQTGRQWSWLTGWRWTGWATASPDDAFDASDPPPGEGERGGRMLVDLADVLRGAGLAVEEVDGWQFRSRSGAGYRQEGPIGDHRPPHRVRSRQRPAGRGRPAGDPLRRRPDGNLYLDRSGRYWVCAAGATNTNGKGGPLRTAPADSANSRVIGIEAGNNGIGEPWPEVMQDAYVAGVAALAEAYRHRHGAHPTPTTSGRPGARSTPPARAGSAVVNGHQSWDMDRFRAGGGRPAWSAAARAVGRPAAASGARAADGRRYVVQPGDSWWSIAERSARRRGGDVAGAGRRQRRRRARCCTPATC